MVIDSSAIIAILAREPDSDVLMSRIEEADRRRISATNWVESSMVAQSRWGASGLLELDALIDKAGIEIEAVDRLQGRIAREAFSRYGKGRHPAALNLGDCFAYALAQAMGETLLCKGDDFRKTDARLAVEHPRPV